MPVGMLLVAAALVLFAHLPVHGHYFWISSRRSSLSGIGLALAFVPMSIGALTGSTQSDAGVASGLINTSQQIGGAIGVAVATTIATTFTRHYVSAHVGAGALGGQRADARLRDHVLRARGDRCVGGRDPRPGARRVALGGGGGGGPASPTSS